MSYFAGRGEPEEAPPLRIQVTMVVLGDIGRSPRMQYHALALAAERAEVHIIGYSGSPLWPEVRAHRHIRCSWLSPRGGKRGQRRSRLIFLLGAALKVLCELGQLLWRLLWMRPRPDVVLVQNPPAIPTLGVAWVAARLRRSRFVIDWHNLGYAMLALHIGPHHFIVRLAQWYERTLGRLADSHLCVSQAMQNELRQWGLDEVVVLRDQPSPRFAPTPLPVQHDLWRRLQNIVAYPDHIQGTSSQANETFMTCLHHDASAREDAVALRLNRPALLVSPTSWTADEDFDLLIDALVRCEALIQARETHGTQPFPPLLLLITGKGPWRVHFEKQLTCLALPHIAVRTLWLAPEDYPLVLGAADLGLCLHRSASGLDLPMKVMDMLGSGVPVCALDYAPCLAEQLRHGQNGLLFQTSEQLAHHIYTLFQNFPSKTPLLNQLHRQLGNHHHIDEEAGEQRYAAVLFDAL